MPPIKTKHGYINETKDDNGNTIREYIKDTGFHSGQNVVLEGRKGRLYEEQHFDPQKEVDEVLKRLTEKKPALAPYLKSLKLPQTYFDYLKVDPYSAQGVDMKTTLNREISALNTAFLPSNLVDTALAPYKMNMHYPKIGEYLGLSPAEQMRLSNMPEFDEVALELCEDMNDILTRVTDNANNRIPNGADVSRYHEVMEDVADMLGFPEMVAKSRRVPILKDGKVEFATFVEQPEGHNLADMKEDNIFLDKSHNPMMDPGALKLLSNMSVLDYIIGATHYDMTDLTFQTDPNDPKKITNIVRHSPGDCFGLSDPEKRIDHRSTAPYLRDIRVIPKSTADNLKDPLFQSNLRFVMSGKGFTQEQIDLCCLRAGMLQAALGQPTLKITDDDRIMTMTDADFKKVKPQELYVKMSVLKSGEKLQPDLHGGQYCKNIFARSAAIREEAKLLSTRRVEEITGEAFDHLFRFEKPIQTATERDLSMSTLSARFKEVDPPLLRSSPEFRSMKTAMGALARKLPEMRRKREEGTLTLQEIRELKADFAEVKNHSFDYIEKKDRNGIRGSHGKERYDFVKMVNDYSQKMIRTLEQSVNQRLEANQNLIRGLDARVESLKAMEGEPLDHLKNSIGTGLGKFKDFMGGGLFDPQNAPRFDSETMKNPDYIAAASALVGLMVLNRIQLEREAGVSPLERAVSAQGGMNKLDRFRNELPKTENFRNTMNALLKKPALLQEALSNPRKLDEIFDRTQGIVRAAAQEPQKAPEKKVPGIIPDKH